MEADALLRGARAEAKLTQAQLARRLGTPDERTLARPRRLQDLADIEALEVARRLQAEEDQRPRSGA
jgi:transcriptional regulator with XRE-family HTH domain